MSKIKEFYHEQISQGLSKEEVFLDEEYQGISHHQCTDKCVHGEDVFCPKVLEIMEERAMEQSFELDEGNY